MNVAYWQNFYKRKNSTRQPASAGTNAAVTLKEPCSFWNPEIECVGVPRDANYFKIPSGIFLPVDAYYFVSDVISVTHAMTRFKLTLDPLATYKSSIAASWQYVKRANAPATFNRWIRDDLNMPSTSNTVQSTTTDIKVPVYDGGGDLFPVDSYRFVLSVLGASAQEGYPLNNGLAKTYYLDGLGMLNLCIKLNSSTFLEDLVLELTNPTDAIIKCRAMTLNLSGMIRTTAEPVFFGSHSSTVMANVITQRVRIIDVDLTAPAIMTGQQDYTHLSPYVTATIFLPLVGVCPLDVDAICGRNLTLRVAVDNYTGDVTYAIKDRSTGYVYQTFSGNCATDCPVGRSDNNTLGVASGILTTIGGIAAGSPMMAASGVLSALQGLEMHTQINGSYSSSLGSFSGNKAVITAYISDPAHGITDNAAEEGLPYEKREFLGNLSGYILCRNGNIDIPGSERDKDVINAYLNSGFFLE